MKKQVLISITGLHYAVTGGREQDDPIEVITPAAYYLKNGKHYIIYDEVLEGTPGTVKNTVKIIGDSKLEMHKSGAANTCMIFEKNKIHMTEYQIPFGEVLVGIYTRDMQVEEKEDEIHVEIAYSLDINQEHISDCNITVHVKSVGEENGSAWAGAGTAIRKNL